MRPEIQARRSVLGAFCEFAERPGGIVVGRNRVDEGVEGHERSGEMHGWSRAVKVAVVVVGEGEWSDDRDGKGGSWHEPNQADAGKQGSQVVKPQGRRG